VEFDGIHKGECAVRGWQWALFIIAALRSGPPAVADAPLTQPVSFALGAVTYATRVPAKAALQPSIDGRSVTIRDLSKSMRLDRALVLTLDAGAARFDRIARLADGNSLAYREDDDTGGGSGGPTAELTGMMVLGNVPIFVTCTDQGELSRDPRWCLPILEELKIAPPPR
jgi:hypothetical protein